MMNGVTSCSFLSAREGCRKLLFPGIAAVALALASSPLWASVAAGVEAYLYGDYEQARQDWSAQPDSVVAGFNLGMLYLQGLGVDRDPVVAATYLKRSAARGYAPAQYQLARLLLESDKPGSGQDAVFWLRAAANQSHGGAAYWLGSLYGEGKTVPQDVERALRWLRKADDAGFPAAAAHLARLEPDLQGFVREEDDIQLTARLKSGRGTLEQRRVFFEGQKAFINQDYATAVNIWVPLAEDGVAKAQYGIAFMLESGWGVVQDAAEAAHWYKLAAQKGHRKAQFNLGKMYIDGAGIEKNRGIGLFWIQSSADLGEPRALEYMEKLQRAGPSVSITPTTN